MGKHKNPAKVIGRYRGELVPQKRRSVNESYKRKLTRMSVNTKRWGMEYEKKDYPDLKVDHPDLYAPGYPPDKKIEACTQYILQGSARKAEDLCGVRANTILEWRRTAPWWDTVAAQIKLEYGDEIDSNQSRIIRQAYKHLEERFEVGDPVVLQKTGEIVFAPVSALATAKVASTLVKDRNLLRGEATTRSGSDKSTGEEEIENVVDKKLASIKEKLEKSSALYDELQAKTIDGEVIED